MVVNISQILSIFYKNIRGCNFHMEKLNIRCMSNHVKVAKQLNLKNNFAFRNEFHERLNEEKKKRLSRIVSSDLISNKNELIDRRERRRTNPSVLGYRGEILFGIHPVYLALLQKKRQLFCLFVRKSDLDQDHDGALRKKEMIKMADSLNLPVVTLNTKDIKYLAPGSVHQGVCLDAGPLPLMDWKKDNQMKIGEAERIPLWLVLDEILDPMNVGSIIRSAYYFGVTKIFTLKGNSCKLSPTVSKASSGALEVMNIFQLTNLEEFIQATKNCGWSVISTLAYCENKALEQHVAPIMDASQFKISKPTILILGNEGQGISSSVQKLCDAFISINPGQNLQQGIDSLNVSVAAGVILYSLLKSNYYSGGNM